MPVFSSGLSVVRLDVPALRNRREDIPLLVDHFLERTRKTLGKTLRAVDGDTLERLVSHAWPGNIRELENVIERAAIIARVGPDPAERPPGERRGTAAPTPPRHETSRSSGPATSSKPS